MCYTASSSATSDTSEAPDPAADKVRSVITEYLATAAADPALAAKPVSLEHEWIALRHKALLKGVSLSSIDSLIGK